MTSPESPAPTTRRLLVVANRTCPCSELLETILDHAVPGTRTLIVAPAPNNRLAHWVSDTDGALRDAHSRLDEAVSTLGAAGLDVSGVVGDADPFAAIADSLVDFPADELIISSWPPGRSHWLEKDLLRRVRDRHAIPVHHVVSAYGLADEEQPRAPLSPPAPSASIRAPAERR